MIRSIMAAIRSRLSGMRWSAQRNGRDAGVGQRFECGDPFGDLVRASVVGDEGRRIGAEVRGEGLNVAQGRIGLLAGATIGQVALGHGDDTVVRDAGDDGLAGEGFAVGSGHGSTRPTEQKRRGLR